MKTKQFVLFQLKSWLPMIIAFGALVLSITVIIGLNARPYIYVNVEQSTTYVERYPVTSLDSDPLSCIGLMMIPSMVASFVLPFFAYSHRYGKARADCFLSLPVRSGKITKVRMLLVGAILIAIYLVSYLFGIFAAMAKQCISAASAASTFSSSSIVKYYEIVIGSFGWYFLAWPIGALVVGTLFLINSFLAGQGSNVLQGIIAIIAGHVTICLLFPFTVLTPLLASRNYDAPYAAFGIGYSFFQMPSFYVPIVLIELTLGSLECGTPAELGLANYYVSQWSLWFGSISFLLLGGGALASLLLGKEPGGEFAGENRPRNFFATLLPHLAFLTALIGVTGFMPTLFSLQLGYFAFFLLAMLAWTDGLYYVVLSLYNHNFKLDRKNWIMFASSNGVAILMAVLSLSLRAITKS